MTNYAYCFVKSYRDGQQIPEAEPDYEDEVLKIVSYDTDNIIYSVTPDVTDEMLAEWYAGCDDRYDIDPEDVLIRDY